MLTGAAESPTRGRIRVSAEIGEVSTLTLRPPMPRAVMTLAHGAGAGMDHATMDAIAQALARGRIATLRFNFPFKEHGLPRADARPIATAAIAAATAAAATIEPTLPHLLGGHSFGGRMASHAVLEQALPAIVGLVFFAFPLHRAGTPATARADHLVSVGLPMLFISGTRDALAAPELLQPVIAALGDRARLVWLDTADHSYRVLKRQRKATQSVFEEMADAVSELVTAIAARRES